MSFKGSAAEGVTVFIVRHEDGCDDILEANHR